MGRKHRNVRTEKVTISIDRLTAAVVRRVQEREGTVPVGGNLQHGDLRGPPGPGTGGGHEGGPGGRGQGACEGATAGTRTCRGPWPRNC